MRRDGKSSVVIVIPLGWGWDCHCYIAIAKEWDASAIRISDSDSGFRIQIPITDDKPLGAENAHPVNPVSVSSSTEIIVYKPHVKIQNIEIGRVLIFQNEN